MKKIHLRKNIFYLVFTMIISFLIGYLSTSGYNYFNEIYVCEFSSSISIEQDQLLNISTLDSIKNSSNKYSNIDTEKLIKDGIYLVKSETDYQLITYSRYYDKFFLKDKEIVSSRAKTFLKELLLQNVEDVSFKSENIIETKNSQNSYIFGLLTMGASTILCTIYLIIKNLKLKEEQNTQAIKTLSIFTKEYWKKSKNIFTSPKKITTLAMIFALLLISKMIKIPAGFSNLGLGLGFIFFSIIGILYGPLAGLIIGFLSDILGYFLFDTSGTAFFIGYVFQAMISGFIHGLFLYQKRISFFRLLLLRISIAVICNILIGSFCWGFVANYNFSQTISYMIVFELPKNLIYLIPQSVFLFIIVKAVFPILNKHRLVEKTIAENISLI